MIDICLFQSEDRYVGIEKYRSVSPSVLQLHVVVLLVSVHPSWHLMLSSRVMQSVVVFYNSIVMIGFFVIDDHDEYVPIECAILMR